MKIFTFILLIIQIGILKAEVMPITLENVAQTVSQTNYIVKENAERVYQKKENIKVARANLIPKLNIWNLLKLPAVIADPRSIGDIIQDIAPFLIPENWFKLKQSKYELKAQKEQYRALWANEVLTSKLLFTSIVRDDDFLELIKEKSVFYNEIMDIAETRSIFNGENLNDFSIIKGRFLELKEDIRNMENLIYSETKEFQYLIGVNNQKDIQLIKPKLKTLSSSPKIVADKILFKALDASPEMKQYEHLLGALMKIEDQIKFSVFGSSTASTAGGYFSNIPMSNGLGFGLIPTLNISKSEGRILKIQLEGSMETIKRQVNVLVNEYNSLIENYDLIKERGELAKNTYESFMAQIAMGGTLNPLEFIEIINTLFSSKILALAYEYRFNDVIEKLSRITFSTDYIVGPKEMEDMVNEN